MSPPNRPRSIASPSASTDRPDGERRLSRRTFVAAGSATALVSLAGCSAVVDFLADFALQDVNVFNGADQSVSGTIEITDSDGEVVLEEEFDLEEEPEDGEETDQENPALVQYDDVFGDEGDYEVTVALDEPLEDAGDENGSGDSNESDGNETDSEADATSESDVDANESDAANDTDESAAANDTDENDGAGEDDGETQTGPSKTDTVTIENADEEKLAVGIAQEGPADLLSYHVIEDFSDLGDEFE